MLVLNFIGIALLSGILFLGLTVISTFAKDIEKDKIDEPEIGIASPIDDGILFTDFNEENGFRHITIRNENLLNEYTDILASEDGKVITLGVTPNDKYYVVIQHGDGYLTKYSRLSSLNISLKDEVSKHDVIGQSIENKVEFIIIKDGERLANTSEILGLK